MSYAPQRSASVECGARKNEVCGQWNVINLFRDEDKRAEKFLSIGADRKGNFANALRRAARAKFRAAAALAYERSGSHRARSQIFVPRRTIV